MPEEVEPASSILLSIRSPSNADLAEEDEEIDAAPEADRPKKKKKKPTHHLSHKEPPAEAKRAIKDGENVSCFL